MRYKKKNKDIMIDLIKRYKLQSTEYIVKCVYKRIDRWINKEVRKIKHGHYPFGYDTPQIWKVIHGTIKFPTSVRRNKIVPLMTLEEELTRYKYKKRITVYRKAYYITVYRFQDFKRGKRDKTILKGIYSIVLCISPELKK